MNFKGERYHHSHATAFSWNERVDNSCKQRAVYVCCSLFIVYTEHGRWQASFILKKLAYPVEVSVMKHSFQIPRNPGETGHVQTVCTRLFLSAHTGEPENEASAMNIVFEA